MSNRDYCCRVVPDEHPIRGEFFRDQTAIIHSLPFRRLKHKTQVFFAPENDHVCTRIEHVLHVATIGATICKGLNNEEGDWLLDTEMAYAIGLGHDLGHAPFGHAGETALSALLGSGASFIHEVQSLRVVDKLCNDGAGLNLTYGVRDGIVNHNGEKFEQLLRPSVVANDLDAITDRSHVASSFEGCIVRFADKIAYLGRDIEDALIAGFISKDDIPMEIRQDVGSSNGDIINSLIIDVIDTSKELDAIKMSDEMFAKVSVLKDFNYKRIYNHPTIKSYEAKVKDILGCIFGKLLEVYDTHGMSIDFYKQSDADLIKHFGEHLSKYSAIYTAEGNIPKRMVCDFIAGMTDGYALNAFRQISIPTPIKFY